MSCWLAATVKAKVRTNLSPTSGIQLRVKKHAAEVVKVVNVGRRATVRPVLAEGAPQARNTQRDETT